MDHEPSITPRPRLEPEHSLAGRILVAMPGIDDERFEHAVILVCAHTDEHALGVRLDQPARGVTLARVMERLGIEMDLPNADAPVLSGGPVERERGFVIHSDDWRIEEATLPIRPGLGLTTTREALLALSGISEGPRRAFLALGYAGWDAGQLEGELLENVWLTLDADEALIFDDDYAGKWSRALALLGINAANLSSLSGHA
ncbi:MAG: YqgE/AlgH family protein [Brevundimonas sp.]|uniref:YqgE/AlgH family protein n=1 Tax=Brevundimonas sp. TaxID=1871086 RepID=UPI00391E02E8